MVIDLAPAPAPRKFPTMGPRVIRFIEQRCIFTAAGWAGRPFILQPWQRELLLDLFEVVWNPELEKWVRRYTEALIGMPKKNGKTELVAALAHYFLHADGEPAPLITVAAASERQANWVFGAAAAMAKAPQLATRCRVYNREIQRLDAPDSAKILRLASNAGKNDGPNIFVALMDEFHEWTPGNAEQNYNVLTNAGGAREQPLAIEITTAGFDLDGTICGRKYQYGRKVESGEVEDSAFFFRWYAAPEDLDWRSMEAVKIANPSFGVIQGERFYRDQQRRKPEAVYRRYFLNQWTEGESAWLPYGAFAKLKRFPPAPPAIRLSVERGAGVLVPGAPTWVGWDSSTKVDSTAVVAVQWLTLGDVATKRDVDYLVVFAWVWERPIDPNTGEPDENWIVPLTDEVVPLIHALAATYDVQAIAYDPAFVTWEAAKLQEIGYPVKEFSQQTGRLTVASQNLYEKIVQGIVAHDGDPVLARHVRAAAAKQTSQNGAWRLVKGAAKRKMDATIALAMGAYYATRLDVDDKPAKKEPNVWGSDDDDETEVNE